MSTAPDDFDREEQAFREAFAHEVSVESFRPLDPGAVRAAAAPRRPVRWLRGVAAAASVVVAVGAIGLVLPRLVGSSASSASVEAAPAAAGAAASPDLRSETGVTAEDVAGASPGAAATVGEWQELPTFPLSPRADASVGYAGERFYVVGGREPTTCPAGAACPAPRNTLLDGASYDPVSDTWLLLPAAPIVVARSAPVLLGNRLYYLGSDAAGEAAFAALDVADLTWTVVRAPDSPGRLVAAGDRLVSSGDTDDPVPGEVFDPNTGVWTDLPDDPLPAGNNRSVVWLDNKLLLVSLARPSTGGGSVARVAVLDDGGTWVRARIPKVAGYDPVVVGRRIVWNRLDGLTAGTARNAAGLQWLDASLATARTAAPVPAEDGLAGIAGVVAGNRVGAVDAGGEAGHLYDFDAGAWVQLPALPGGNAAGQSVGGSPNGLLVVGGTVDGSGASCAYLPLA